VQSYGLPNVIDTNLIVFEKFILVYALYSLELIAQVGIQGMGILMCLLWCWMSNLLRGSTYATVVLESAVHTIYRK